MVAWCAVLVLLPSMPGSLLSQADSQAASAQPPVSVPVPRPLLPGSWAEHGVHEYQLSSIYDRVTDRTRVTVVPRQKYRPSYNQPNVSFSVSVTYSGREPTPAPDSVVFEVAVFSPARGGWPLAHPERLKVTLNDTIHLEFPSADYRRMSVHLNDRGRNETLDFRIPTTDFLSLAASSRARLKIGRFTIKLDQPGLDGLRALVPWLMPAGR